MSYYVIDVEGDGTSPATSSMVCFGAVKVCDDLFHNTFYGRTSPISKYYNPEALAISGFSREEHEGFDDPELTMKMFADWVNKTNVGGRATFISDNPAYDWMWICFYFDKYDIKNPFGYSARRIGDLYCGMKMDAGKNSEWKKKYRITKHTHHPVDDGKGNAEALLAMKKMGLKINFQ